MNLMPASPKIHLYTNEPISQKDAVNFGKFLRQYEIGVSGVEVWYHYPTPEPDGRWVKGDAVSKTITDVAGGIAAGVASAPAVGTVAAPVVYAAAAAFPPLLIMAGLVTLFTAEVAALHASNMRQKGGPSWRLEYPDYSCIKFNFRGVSERRREWAEYCTAVYCANQGWTPWGFAHKQTVGQGQSYVFKNGQGAMPKPWNTKR